MCRQGAMDNLYRDQSIPYIPLTTSKNISKERRGALGDSLLYEHVLSK